MSTLLETLEQVTRPFADLSVIALQADDAACGHYRIRYPMEMLARGGAKVEITAGLSMASLLPYDVILAQRQYHPNIYEMLREVRRMGKTVIYEIDDNVHAVHPNSVAFKIYKPGSETCQGVEKFIRGSDALFTSSPELASQYGAWNKRTWVLPNCIDVGIRQWDDTPTRDPRLLGKVVVGWAGSITHQDDYAPLKGVMDVILAKYPQAVFAIVSAHQTMDAFTHGLNLPADRVVRLDPTTFEEYPRLPAQFDIGLVPVVNTTFNRAKSDLKPLEYGARRVPYVASTLAPYTRLHRETGGQGGFLATRAQEWIAAISRLIEDEGERRARGQFMYDYVRRERAIGANVYRWADAIRQARDARHYTPEGERRYQVPEKPGRNDRCPCGSGTKYKRCCSPSWG